MRVTAAQLTDLVVDPADGTSVVMVDQQVLALSALATSVLLRVRDDARTVEEITSHLVAAFGEPPAGRDKAGASTAAVVQTLLDQRVLMTDGSES